MKRFKIKKGMENWTARGNYLCGLLLEGLAKQSLPDDFQPRRSDAISDQGVLLTMIGLLSNGRSDFNDVDLYRGDRVFAHAYGIERLPSEAVLGQRLDDLPPLRSHAALRELNRHLLSQREFGTVQAGHLRLVPVDIEVSPLDNSGSSKQGVSFTYKKHDGYAPIFAYLGTEWHMLDCELRPGSQHCQSGTPEFIGACVKTLDTLGLSGHCLGPLLELRS